jgi:hypothetical protein
MMRKALLVTAALVVAVIFFLLLTLPPRPIAITAAVDSGLQRRTMAGAYHIHSTRSDGSGDKDAIAAAAARAGLTFIILTDHGDGMRPPDPPAYLHGVLCIDGVEISTNGGHYVALDMAPAPYPLGGEPSAVVEDVRRLGGFGIAAHPDSPRAQLAWRDWTAAIDGIEWLSADTEWRNESRPALARAFFDYAWRPGPALASLLDRPSVTLERWDRMAVSRPVVALAGHDAHGGIGRGTEEGGTRRSAVGGIPSYEASFRSFSTRAMVDRPPTGDAAADARQLLDAIRNGRVFTVIDALATPAFLEYEARQGSGGAPLGMGSVNPGGGSAISVKASMPPRATMVLVGTGGELMQTTTSPLVTAVEPAARGAFRVEVRVPRAPGNPPIPWLVSNPIYFLPPPAEPPPAPAHAATTVIPMRGDVTWHVEKDPESSAGLKVSGGAATLDYTLRAGDRASQFAALVANLEMGAPQFSRIHLTASAARPGRLSLQLRFPQRRGERWAKSVYVDSVPREVSIAVADMLPADRQSGAAPDPSSAAALLFVIDLTNARPGDSNSIHVRDIRFAR